MVFSKPLLTAIFFAQPRQRPRWARAHTAMPLHQPHHYIHITSTTKQKQESSHRANLFHFIEVQCTPYPPPKPTSSMYNCTYLKWAMSRALLMCLMQRNSYISADKTCVMVKHAFVGAQNSMLWIQCMFRRKKSFLRRSNHQSIIVYKTNYKCLHCKVHSGLGGVIMEWPALFIVHIFINVHIIYIAMQLAFRLGEV